MDKGHQKRRDFDSFPSSHATSPLKNAGVTEAVAMGIIGHESESISRHYTHIENRAEHSALNQRPRLH